MNILYCTLSHHNSVLIGDDTVYADTYINLSQPLNLTANGVALVDIEGYAAPPVEKGQSYYLCCDFIEPSILHDENDTIGMYPILRRITFNQNRLTNIDGQVQPSSAIHEIFGKLIFIPCSRNSVPTFRLYLIDSQGNGVSFKNFELKCTLLCIPYNKS